MAIYVKLGKTWQNLATSVKLGKIWLNMVI